MYRFNFLYYYKDVTGYYFDTGKRTPITVTAANEADARKKLSDILPADNGRVDFRLFASIKSIEEVEGQNV